MELCGYFDDVPDVFVDVFRKLDNVIKVDQAVFPFIVREYNVQCTLEIGRCIVET